jgi:phosphonate transport system substrate-binding protein
MAALFALTVCLFFASPIAIAAQADDKTEGRTLSLGVVYKTPQKEIEARFGDFVRYIAAQLAAGSRIEGKVITAPSLPQLAKLLQDRQVDFYFESPYPTYVVNHVHGAANLLLRRWKNGVAEYRSLIFTKNESDIKRVQDLLGKTIAFEDPESTSGYFLPKLFLQRNGFKLVEKTRIEASIPPGAIGFVFAHSQEQLVNSVLSRETAAGAFSNDDYARLDENRRGNIRILAQTELLPRHLLSVRKDLPLALTARLEKVLLATHENDEGRRILQKTDETTKFDALPGGEAAIRRRLLDTFYSTSKK